VCDEADPEVELCPLAPCEADEPCEAEPPELWLLPELPEELDPPEEPWDPPPPEPPELPPPPEECCANAADEKMRTAARPRLESRIKHLLPNRNQG